MNTIRIALLVAFICLAAPAGFAQQKAESKLKTYYLVFLKKGPKRDQDSATAAQIQTAHIANIGALYKSGKLDLAGPLLDDGELLGIFVLNVPTKEEAERLAGADPAVRAGRLTVEVHPWMSAPGSALR